MLRRVSRVVRSLTAAICALRRVLDDRSPPPVVLRCVVPDLTAAAACTRFARGLVSGPVRLNLRRFVGGSSPPALSPLTLSRFPLSLAALSLSALSLVACHRQ